MAENPNSGYYIQEPLENISRITEYGDVIDKGLYCLCKVKRYGKWYFLKGLQTDYRALTQCKEFLKKEFELEIQLDHPNIVHAISWEQDARFGSCFLMEYVDGYTLDEFLKTKPSVKIRKKIMAEILSAMQYFHSLQIVHRDLKPLNILITRKGNNVKIIDFGISDSDTYAIFKQPAGSDGFAAPEQRISGAETDQRCDIYAFGKILNLLFPHAYPLIQQKCVHVDKTKRFASAHDIIVRIRRQKLLSFIIPLVAIIATSIVSVAYLIRQNRDLQTQVEYRSDTVVVHSIDTIISHQTDTVFYTPPAPSDPFTKEQRAALVQLQKQIDKKAKPIVLHLQQGNIPTRIAANDSIADFVHFVNAKIRAKSRTADAAFNKEVIQTAQSLLIHYQLLFQNYTSKLPLGIEIPADEEDSL